MSDNPEEVDTEDEKDPPDNLAKDLEDDLEEFLKRKAKERPIVVMPFTSPSKR